MLTLSTPGPYHGGMPGPRIPTRAAKAPGRPRRTTYHHGDLPRAMVDEAVRIIQAEGVGALTLRGVGAALGVSRSALYRHFADKQALLDAVALEGFRTLRTALRDAWDRAGGGPNRMDGMGLAYVRFAVTHPSHYRVMFGTDLSRRAQEHPQVDETVDAFQVLVDAIVAQQRQGFARADHPRQLALYIWAVVHGVAMLALDGRLPADVDAAALAAFANQRLRTGTAL
jgi:AcrR family transcriptional regulator